MTPSAAWRRRGLGWARGLKTRLIALGIVLVLILVAGISLVDLVILRRAAERAAIERWTSTAALLADALKRHQGAGRQTAQIQSEVDALLLHEPSVEDVVVLLASGLGYRIEAARDPDLRGAVGLQAETALGGSAGIEGIFSARGAQVRVEDGGLTCLQPIVSAVDTAKVVGILEIEVSSLATGRLVGPLLWGKAATALGGVALISLVLYLFVARTLILPTQRLEGAIARLDAGDLDARLRLARPDEAGRLGSGLGRMADTLGTLLKRTAERSRLEEECRLASMIQQALLPGAEAELPHSASALVTSTEVAGDYYDYFILPEPGCYGLCVGDATGHGLAAGNMVTAAKGALYSLVAGGLRSPAEVLHLLSQAIRQTARGQALMTFFFAIVDSERRRLVYANAGHNFPYILRGDTGELDELALGGVPLGFKSSSVASAEVRTWLFAGEGMERYDEGETPFQSGDLLVVYSDGLVEGENPDGEPYDYPRFEESIRRHGHLAARLVCRRIRKDAFDFYAGRDPDDDITLLVAKHL